MKDSFLPVAVLVFSSILWGLSWMPLKALNQFGLEGIPLLFVSHLILALLLLPKGCKRAEFRGHIRSLLGVALFGGGAILCFTYSLMYGQVIRVMVLFYLLPVWGVFGGKFFLGETVDKTRWFGVSAAIVGAFLILGGVKVFESPPSWIDLLALLSGLAFAANNILFRGVQSVCLPTKLFTMFCGCAFISATLLIFEVQSWPLDVDNKVWTWFLLYVLTWMLAANIGSQWAITRMDAGRSSIIIIVELVAAVLSAMIVGGERLEYIEWLGCALVMVAAFVEAKRAH